LAAKTSVNKAVFLDRDGTINVEKNYLYKPEDFEFILGVPKAIESLNRSGYKVIVISNQSGVARGYYSEDDLLFLHEYIERKLAAENARIDAFYYCPHHPLATVEKYRVDCNCRKPKPGLFERAIKDFDVDITKSWAVGDRMRDVKPALNLGIRGALLLTGQGNSENVASIRYVASDLPEFVEKIIMNRFLREGCL
jgi:D-glycero-D-manno-heptose 1,7-bisphosphate phosphatase